MAGADVPTLRERLIDALETHRDKWPSACPPLEPARYSISFSAVWAGAPGLGLKGVGTAWWGSLPLLQDLGALERVWQLLRSSDLGPPLLWGPAW